MKMVVSRALSPTLLSLALVAMLLVAAPGRTGGGP